MRVCVKEIEGEGGKHGIEWDRGRERGREGEREGERRRRMIKQTNSKIVNEKEMLKEIVR